MNKTKVLRLVKKFTGQRLSKRKEGDGCPDKIEPNPEKELNAITARLKKKYPEHYN
jgi:hypothetical protein